MLANFYDIFTSNDISNTNLIGYDLSIMMITSSLKILLGALDSNSKIWCLGRKNLEKSGLASCENRKSRMYAYGIRTGYQRVSS